VDTSQLALHLNIAILYITIIDEIKSLITLVIMNIWIQKSGIIAGQNGDTKKGAKPWMPNP